MSNLARFLSRTSTCFFVALWFILFLSPPAFSQDWNWEWVDKIGIGGRDDCASAEHSATDADGNTYVVGNYYRNITFGGTSYNGPNYLYGNFYVAKYDSQGKVVWSNRFYGSSNPDALGVNNIQVDKLGRVYVSGFALSSVAFGNAVHLKIPRPFGTNDVYSRNFIVQYSSNGVASWAKFIGGDIAVVDDTIYSLGLLHDGYSSYVAWNNDYWKIYRTDSILCYNTNAQLIRKIINSQNSNDYQQAHFVVSNDNLSIAGIGLVSGDYRFLVSTFDPGQNKFSAPILLPYELSAAKFEIHKNAIYFLGCFNSYGNGQLQLGNLLLVSSDAAQSYHTEGYLVKYDLASNQFVWGKNIRKMDCGFNYLLKASPIDVLYVSSEQAGINDGNYIRAYSTNGDSLWTRTTSAYIVDHNALGTDRYGNVYVTGGVFNGASSNAYFGIVPVFRYDYDVGFLAKISPDLSPKLTLINKTPAPNETNISVNRSFQLTFSEPVYFLSGKGKKFNIYNAMTNASIRSLVLASGNTTISGNQITIKLPSSLPVGTTVYVQLDAGTFVDLSGNAFGGILDKSWTYSTAGGSDKQPPTLITTIPFKGATNVLPNAALNLIFSENVLPGTGSIYFYNASNDALVMSIQASSPGIVVSGRNVTIPVATPLPTGMTLYVKTDSNVFKDGAGNPFAGIQDKLWSFTTIGLPDIQPPSLLSRIPTAGATNVNTITTLQFHFSENVVRGIGTVHVFNYSNNAEIIAVPVTSSSTIITGTEAIVTFSAALPASTKLYVKVDYGTFKDVDSNSFPGIIDKSWSFTTAALQDTQPPLLIYKTPENGATDVSANTMLFLNFSENIVIGTGNIHAFNAFTNAEVATLPITSSNTMIVDRQAIVTFPTPFPANITLYIKVDSGTLRDLAGNIFAGISDKSWSFTTSANVPACDTDPPTGNSPQQLHANASIADLIANGSQIEWYAAASGGSALAASTLLINGAHYYASQTLNSCESSARLDVAVTLSSAAKTTQTITFAPLPSKLAGDAPFTLTATASSQLPVSYISSNNAIVVVSGSTVTIVGSGTVTIIATQIGNEIFSAAPYVKQTLTIKRIQTISFTPLSPKVYGNVPFSLNGLTDSKLTVTYTSSDPSVATVTGSVVRIVGVGSTTITASQSGNASYAPSPDVSQELTVSKASQIIMFNSLQPKSIGNPAFNVTTSASSNLPVSLRSSNTDIAAISGMTITIVGEGSAVITASQEGNSNYNPATEVSQTLKVKKGQLITFEPPAPRNLQESLFELTATASSGLPVTFTISNSKVATISGNKVTIHGTGSATITAFQNGDSDFGPARPVTQTLTVGLITAINDVSNSMMGSAKLYPNPANEKVVLELPGAPGVNDIKIVAADGGIVHQQTTNLHEVEINTKIFQSGIYFIIITNSKELSTQKLLIQR